MLAKHFSLCQSYLLKMLSIYFTFAFLLLWLNLEIISCLKTVFSFQPSLNVLCMHAHLLSRVWLCDSVDYSLPGSSVYGIFQARILEWVAICFSRGPSWSRNRTRISCIFYIGRQILYHLRSPWMSYVYLLLSCWPFLYWFKWTPSFFERKLTS